MAENGGWRNVLESKLRTRRQLIREGFAEFLGTFLLIVFGDGVVAQFVFGRGAFGTFETVCWGYGLAITMGIMISGGVSGGHINPAVSLAMAVIGKLSWIQLPVYMLSQYAGAILGSACLFGVYYDALEAYDGGKRATSGKNATAGIWATYPQAYLSAGGALGDQIFTTFLFLIVIMAVTDERNMKVAKGLVPLYIGLTITLIGMAFGINCGFAVNPARDLGPRIFTAMAGWGSKPFSYQDHYFWVPIVGPHIGAIFGVIVYLLLVGIHNNEDDEGTGKTAPLKSNETEVVEIKETDVGAEQ